MEKSDEEIKQDMKKIQERLRKTALGINFIQEKYKKRFVELAQEEYGNDYGVTLKELLKIYDGFYPKGTEEIDGKLNILANEIKEIKKRLDSPKEDKKDPPEGYVYSADRSKLIKKS